MATSSYSLSQKRREHKLLTQFPAFPETYGKKIAIVGVSSRGCKIAYDLSRQLRQVENFLYITCDAEDVASVTSGKKILIDASKETGRSPSRIRGIAFSHLEKIKEALQGAHVTFVIVGLGGSAGSGLAPLVAECAKQVHSMVVGIISMPFTFEKHKYFFAGCALRQLRDYSDGIMRIENNTLLNANKPLIEANADLNEGLSLTLNSLLEPVEKDGTSNGVLNIVDFIKANPYTVLRTPEENRMKEADLENVNGSGNYLISFQSAEDTTKLINAYDPVDISLKRAGNLDPGFDSSPSFPPSFLQNLESGY